MCVPKAGISRPTHSPMEACISDPNMTKTNFSGSNPPDYACLSEYQLLIRYPALSCLASGKRQNAGTAHQGPNQPPAK